MGVVVRWEVDGGRGIVGSAMGKEVGVRKVDSCWTRREERACTLAAA